MPPECELCGKETSNLKRAKIEGTILEVCNDCCALGVELSIPNLSALKTTGQLRKSALLLPSEDIADNYSQLIRNARQNSGLTIEQLAIKISEKDFVVRRVEEGKLKPDMELGRKFEKCFGIKLVIDSSEKSGAGVLAETINDVDSNDQNNKNKKQQEEKLTLGDFIKIKKNKL